MEADEVSSYLSPLTSYLLPLKVENVKHTKLELLILVINLVVELGDEVIEHLLLHVAHGKLLLRILTNLGNPGTTGTNVVFTNALAGRLVKFVEMVVVENELIAPRPAIVAVAVIDVGKAVEHLSDVLNVTVLHIVDEALFFAGWQQQA